MVNTSTATKYNLISLIPIAIIFLMLAVGNGFAQTSVKESVSDNGWHKIDTYGLTLTVPWKLKQIDEKCWEGCAVFRNDDVELSLTHYPGSLSESTKEHPSYRTDKFWIDEKKEILVFSNPLTRNAEISGIGRE